MDIKTAGEIRNLLLKAAKLIDASIKKDSGGSKVCTHDDCEQLTTMAAETRTYLCSDCGYTWTEEFNDEDEEVFKGSKDGRQISLF